MREREKRKSSHFLFKFTPLITTMTMMCIQPVSMDYGGGEVDAYLVVYSVTDRSSFVYAQTCLADLKRRRKTLPPPLTSSAVVLVANKQDLVRNRVVSESGRLSYDCVNHVDFTLFNAVKIIVNTGNS